MTPAELLADAKVRALSGTARPQLGGCAVSINTLLCLAYGVAIVAVML